MFGLEVVLYLCLGGLGGGLSLVAGMAGLSIPRQLFKDGLLSLYSNLMGSAGVLAAVSLVLGSLFLLVDSSALSALTYLFFAPPLSYLSIGAWLIVINIGLCFVLVLFWRTGSSGHEVLVSRVLHAACALVGFGVALYTGFFLASMKAVPLWNTPWLPALFVLSSASCGLVFFLALAKATDGATLFPSFIKVLAKVDLVLVLLESVCAAVLLSGLLLTPNNGSSAAAGIASALDVVTGDYAWIWWGGFVGLGLIATAVFDILVARAKSTWSGRVWPTLGVSFCVLVGAFSLRYCMVMAGAHPALGF